MWKGDAFELVQGIVASGARSREDERQRRKKRWQEAGAVEGKGAGQAVGSTEDLAR